MAAFRTIVGNVSTPYVRLKNRIGQVDRELKAGERKRRGQAARHLKNKIASKIRKTETSLPGEAPGQVTGNLLKGLSMRSTPSTTIIGFKAPGFHSRMLEFGTQNMAARPVLFPTFAEELNTLKKIHSGTWIKDD